MTIVGICIILNIWLREILRNTSCDVIVAKSTLSTYFGDEENFCIEL